jgi:hypothetical protein
VGGVIYVLCRLCVGGLLCKNVLRSAAAFGALQGYAAVLPALPEDAAVQPDVAAAFGALLPQPQGRECVFLNVCRHPLAKSVVGYPISRGCWLFSWEWSLLNTLTPTKTLLSNAVGAVGYPISKECWLLLWEWALLNTFTPTKTLLSTGVGAVGWRCWLLLWEWALLNTLTPTKTLLSRGGCCWVSQQYRVLVPVMRAGIADYPDPI